MSDAEGNAQKFEEKEAKNLLINCSPRFLFSLARFPFLRFR